ncbi:hypothetical protein [Streptomyces albus]|uniref:hypothetical protein n=1 Tax=Streptomyces albus TaxID=1888 RepID=UPI0034018A9C
MNARDEIAECLWLALPSTDSDDAKARAEQMLRAYRAEVLREAADAIEDRACDADFTEEPLLIVGLRSAGDIVRRMADDAERGGSR